MEASEQNEGQAGEEARPAPAPVPGPATKYVVQRKVTLDEGDVGRVVWEDVMSVDVPQRSKRTLAVREALRLSDVVVPQEGVTFRVLTEECAEEISARTEHTPQLVIG